MAIKKGDIIQIHYTGTLSNGEVFDSSDGRDPLEFEAGSGQVIEGFDKAVMGMKEGEEKTFTIIAKEAYGEHSKELLTTVPRDALPKDQTPKEGVQIILTLANGDQRQATISKVTSDEVTIDLNHPLAGKDLTFKIRIEKIAPREAEE